MRDALTATQLSILRCPIQWSRIYVAVHRPQTLFSARLSAVPTYPAASLSFSSGTPTTGTVPAGTTVYIGSSAGARDKGLVRVRSAITLGATGTIAIAEIGDKLINLAVNDYLTVVEDYRPAPKFPRYSGGAWYMDYDVAYDSSVAKQNDDYGPLARLGPAAAGFIVGGACWLRYVGERSAAYSPSNALDTWAWAFPDGSSSASEGTTASPVAVNYTAAIPNGEYHSLTVTENTTNKTHTGYRLTFVFERTGANAPYDAVILGNISGGPRQGGYTCDLRVVNTTADQDDFPDGAHVLLFEEAYFADESGPWYEITDITDPTSQFVVGNPVIGSTSLAQGEIVAIGNGYIHLAVTSGEFIPGELIVDDLAASASAHIYAPNIGGNYPYRSNVLMEGWIVAETVRKDPETGEIDFTVGTLDSVLKTLEGYPVALTNRSTTPALDWESYKRTTMNTATLHFVLWRSTIAAIADVEFQEYGPPNTAIMKYVTLDKSSLFEQLNGYWQRTMLGWVACDLQGALYCEMDAVIDETVRAQVPTIWTVTKDSDLRDDLEIPRRIIDANSQTVLYAVAYRKPLGSKSPGDPHGVEGVTLEITDGVAGPLVGGDVSLPDQSTLNVWAGNLRAQANNRYADVPHQLAGNWRIDPVPQGYFIESFSAGDTVRGITLTSQKWLPRALRLAYSARSYALLADVTADAETIGLGGVAIELLEPQDPVIDVPPPPPPPPPIEPLPTADATEVWLWHYNAASTPAAAIIYSTDFFSSLGNPTWQTVAALPADLATIAGGCIRADGATLYVVGYNTASPQRVECWKCSNPKAGSPTWTKCITYGGSAPGGGGVYTMTTGNIIAFDEAPNGYVAFCNTLVSPSAAPNGPLLVAETDEDGQTISTGATRTLPNGTLSYPLGMWANYNTVKAIGKLIKFNDGYHAAGFQTYPGGDGYAGVPDYYGGWQTAAGLTAPHYRLEYGQVGNSIAYNSPTTVNTSGNQPWQTLYRFAITGTPIYSFNGSPFGTTIYVVADTIAGGGVMALYYSLNGRDFYRSGSATWEYGKVYCADLSGGVFGVWVRCKRDFQTGAFNITSGNEFIRYCADISAADATWTAATGNMWSGGSPIMTAGSLTLHNAGLVYA